MEALYKFLEQEQSKLPLITPESYTALLVDELDILFAGKNANGDFVLGSLLNEDDDLKVTYGFQYVVTEAALGSFLHKSIPLLWVMQQAKDLYITKTPYDNSATVLQRVNFCDIPKEYLPLETSFYPDGVGEASKEVIERLLK